ncbi:hypothetical protein [Dongia deserti]|uniref:hypothetical protein n=1 Tax=Dongia deserti TaxID=2268030 RepID=UPI0013C4DD18|nr:hypothetical protein [Dongia deserti]
MNWRNLTILLVALFVTACTNHHVDFEELPDGTAVPQWGGGSLSPSDPWVITTQYASRGVTMFSSNGQDGVFVINDPMTDTPPNVVCPIGVPFGPSNYTGPTTITLRQSTDDVWVTLPPGYGAVTVTAHDSSGNALRSESSSGPNSSGSATGRRVHVEANNIMSVSIDSATPGGRYCFDSVTWQELWY